MCFGNQMKSSIWIINIMKCILMGEQVEPHGDTPTSCGRLLLSGEAYSGDFSKLQVWHLSLQRIITAQWGDIQLPVTTEPIYSRCLDNALYLLSLLKERIPVVEAPMTQRRFVFLQMFEAHKKSELNNVWRQLVSLPLLLLPLPSNNLIGVINTNAQTWAWISFRCIYMSGQVQQQHIKHELTQTLKGNATQSSDNL